MNSNNSQKKSRSKKELPPSILSLFEEDCEDDLLSSCLSFQLESNNKDPKEQDYECMVAYQIKGADGKIFNLEADLNLDQLRALCKKFGCNYVNNKNKFSCRKALYIVTEFKKKVEAQGTAAVNVEERMTNNIVRITNVIFSSAFLESFLSLNDYKTRADYESGNISKKFWAEVEEVMNEAEVDSRFFTEPILEEHDPHYDEIMALKLNGFDMMNAETIRKKVFSLLKVRKEVQQIMTISGEHDHDSYNFMEVAIKKVGTYNNLTKLGCYYFFQRCHSIPDFDSKFQMDVEDCIKGNSTDSNLKYTSDDTISLSAQKKRAYNAISDLSDTAKTIAEQMKETNKLANETILQMKQKNKLLEQSNLITLASALGNRDLLKTLLGNIQNSGNTENNINSPSASSEKSDSV